MGEGDRPGTQLVRDDVPAANRLVSEAVGVELAELRMGVGMAADLRFRRGPFMYLVPVEHGVERAVLVVGAAQPAGRDEERFTCGTVPDGFP
jgi:hypothetical protein